MGGWSLRFLTQLSNAASIDVTPGFHCLRPGCAMISDQWSKYDVFTTSFIVSCVVLSWKWFLIQRVPRFATLLSLIKQRGSSCVENHSILYFSCSIFSPGGFHVIISTNHRSLTNLTCPYVSPVGNVDMVAQSIKLKLFDSNQSCSH